LRFGGALWDTAECLVLAGPCSFSRANNSFAIAEVGKMKLWVNGASVREFMSDCFVPAWRIPVVCDGSETTQVIFESLEIDLPSVCKVVGHTSLKLKIPVLIPRTGTEGPKGEIGSVFDITRAILEDKFAHIAFELIVSQINMTAMRMLCFEHHCKTLFVQIVFFYHYYLVGVDCHGWQYPCQPHSH
jgi:hypothetical protein